MKKKKLVIIDSFALIFRAYYAYPPTLTTKDGELINAAYGFGSLLLQVVEKFHPEYIVAVFDSASPTIRSSEYSGYKANRKERDPDLIQQIPKVKEFLEAFDIPVLNVEGYEADDIIATICAQEKDSDLEKIVVTGDKDLFQLVNDSTSIYLAGRTFSNSKLFNREGVIEKMGITPEQVPDYKGLAGDPSDNIPGVAGIGDKSALSLLQEYKTIENLYENIEAVANRYKNKLAENYEIAVKSKELATVVYDVPITFQVETAKFDYFDKSKVFEMIEKFQFKSLRKKVDALVDYLGLNEAEAEGVIGLFSEETASEESLSKKTLNIDSLDSSDLFIDYEIDDSNSSPMVINISKIVVSKKGDGEIFEIKNEDFDDFFLKVLEKEIKLIGVNLKKVFHFIHNLDVGIDTSKIKFEDLAFATAILSGGIYGHSKTDVLNFCNSKFTEDVNQYVNQLPECYEFIKYEFNKNKTVFNVYTLEKDILNSVIQMERNGITIDLEKLQEFEIDLEKKKAEIEKEIYSHSDYEFNINSPKQVGEILFDKLGLPVQKKTKGGSYSTNEKALGAIIDVHPIVKLILDYREVDKLLSTYIKALPDYIEGDGKIHATFDQMGAVSGRFSSKNPNLQNIPAINSVGVNVRDVFVASRDSIFVAFDYSQQELRILAALANEEKMIKSFNEGEDIHAFTAAILFNKDIDEVTKEERQAGKTLNFSIVYGVSAFGLSENLKIGRKEASELIDNYYKKYSQIDAYFEEKKKEVHALKVAKTILGRERINHMKSSVQWFMKNAVERELLNFAIQGSAADLMKMAMVKIEKVLEKHPAKLLLQIHDEFLFEFYSPNDESALKSFSEDVIQIMENIMDIGVEYKVDMKSGKIWGRIE